MNFEVRSIEIAGHPLTACFCGRVSGICDEYGDILRLPSVDIGDADFLDLFAGGGLVGPSLEIESAGKVECLGL